MPYRLKFDKPPLGYSAGNYGINDTKVSFFYKLFVSSENGDWFMKLLEGFPAQVISMISLPKISPASIDHMLVLFRQDGLATAYINEITLQLRARVRHDIKEGGLVYMDDFFDIELLKLIDVSIPEDVGVLFLFSVDWQKAMYFDFGPLIPNGPGPRSYDFEKLCGQYYAYLLFQDLFKINEKEWDALFSRGWFPFIYLGKSLISEMLVYVRNGWNIDDLLPQFSAKVKSLVGSCCANWQNQSYLQDHIPLLDRASERYLNQDFISAASILYPRIEGIMRSSYLKSGCTENPTSKILPKHVISLGNNNRHEHSFLLPDRFHKYLSKIYFAGFDPGEPAPMSRISVAHGVASPAHFSEKNATIGWLTLLQILLFAENVNPIMDAPDLK